MTESAASVALKAEARPGSLEGHLSRTVSWRLSTLHAAARTSVQLTQGIPYLAFGETVSRLLA